MPVMTKPNAVVELRFHRGGRRDVVVAAVANRAEENGSSIHLASGLLVFSTAISAAAWISFD